MRYAMAWLALMLLITMRLSVTILSMLCRSSALKLIRRALCAGLSCAAPCACQDAHHHSELH